MTTRQAVRTAADPVADAVTELLHRLRGGASVEQLEEVVRQATAATPDDDRLSAALADALAVRDVLATRRRREQELAALYETAGDLSSLRDLDQVLEAIVGRAHGLLGTDATYLMLNDEPRALTRMRVTQGITTEAFKRTELAIGAGLGGLVAATGNPYATADYAADTRFVHTVDALVGGEGLVAILGVPLKRGSRVIGVLFAADRHRRPFSDDEVALLGSLAHHAAIALENATLFDELRQALDDLRAASAQATAASAAIERAAQVHERLTALVLGGRGLLELAQAVVEVLGGALLVLSQHGRLLASAGAADSDLWRAVTAAGGVDGQDASAGPLQVLASSDGARRAVRLTTAGEPLVVAPVAAASESLGVLVSVGRQLDDTEVRSLERAALVTALLLINERSVAEAEERVRGELLDDLLSVPHADVGGLLRRAARLGIDLDRPHVVALCVPDGDDDRRALLAAASALTADRKGVAGAHQGRVVLLLPAGAGAGDAAAELAEVLRSAAGRPVTVGAAGPASGPAALAAAFRDALRCHDVLVALGRTGEGAAPDDLGVYGLLFSQAGREELTGFVRRTVGPVLDYDERRGSELVRTLASWFQHDGNLTRTAADLFVHVNTLYQRLDRVTALLGKDWRHGDQALQVHLALKLHLALPAEGGRT